MDSRPVVSVSIGCHVGINDNRPERKLLEVTGGLYLVLLGAYDAVI